MGRQLPGRISVVDLTFAIWVLAVPVLFSHWLLNSDGDLARHVVIGRYILSHGPRFADPFSFTLAGEPFLAYEWLSQVAFAAVHDVLGLPGIAVLAGLIIAAALALVVAYVRADAGDPWLALLTGMVAAALSSVHWIARPHLFTFLGLAILLHVLRSSRAALLAIPLFAVWANLHPGFLYGLVMLLLWAVGTTIEDIRRGLAWGPGARSRFAPLIAAVVASLANPFGWHLHLHALGLLGSGAVRVVYEFMPLAVLEPSGIICLVVWGGLIVGLAAQQEWAGWHVLLIFGAAVVAALAGRRYVPVFAVFALPVTIKALTPEVRGLPGWCLGGMRAELARSDTRRKLAAPIATALLLALLALDGRLWPGNVLPTRFSIAVFPEAAVRDARSANLDGRLLSFYMWGGYILYMWPGQQLFVDSMADFFGDELLEEYRRLASACGDWEAVLAQRDISLVLFPPNTPLIKALRQRNWRVVHEDAVSVMLSRPAPGMPATVPGSAGCGA